MATSKQTSRASKTSNNLSSIKIKGVGSVPAIQPRKDYRGQGGTSVRELEAQDGQAVYHVGTIKQLPDGRHRISLLESKACKAGIPRAEQKDLRRLRLDTVDKAWQVWQKFMGHKETDRATRQNVPAKGQRSRKTDPEKNAKVEEAATRTTTKYFESIGYTINSVEKDNRGWDLEARRENETLSIEVKGLSGKELSVELTPNEYAALKNSEKGEDYRLCVVFTALTDPRLVVCRYKKKARKWVVEDKPTASILIKSKPGASIKINI